MSNKCAQNESPLVAIKNESTRQRWELFHRAIAYAKQSNVSAMQEADAGDSKSKRAGPALSIIN
jgi:hypothetical protein